MQLAKENAEYSQLFNLLPTPHIIFLPDKDLTIFDQNEAHAKATLVERKNVIGKPFLEVYPDTTKNYVSNGMNDLFKSIRKVAKLGQPDEMPAIKYDLVDDEGNIHERWWKVTHYPIFDKEQKVILVFQATEDITEQVNTASQLERAEASLKNASDLGLVSSWSWDIKKDLVFGDANFANNFGISIKTAQAGLSLQTFIQSIYPDDRKLVSDSITATITTRKPYNVDYRTMRPDGTITWVVARGKVTYDVEDKPIFFDGILFDISERKNTETLLEASERRFNALFDSNILAILTVNMAGKVIQANKTFLKLFGYSKDDLKQGITSETLSQNTNDPITAKIFSDLNTRGESDPVRKEYKRKDGSRFTGLVGTVMFPGDADEFVAFVLDMTETEKLKELNTVKDEFIAMASHQLRTPASTVKQYLGILIAEYAGKLNKDQLQYAKVANEANDREITIIEDLLKTAQIDIKGYNIIKKHYDIVASIQKIVHECTPMLDSRQQKIHMEHKDSKIVVSADPVELSTCITNLIENASKYSDHGKAITIAIKKTKTHVHIAVTDQGVGIATDDLSRIFEKFTRVDNPLSDTVTGNGLGLYWVKRIVELHEGRLTVVSKLGKGTTFTILLPL